jgi:hypothetical protein
MLKRSNIVDPKTLKCGVGKPRNYLDRGVGAITAAPPLNGPLRPASYLRNWRIAFSAGVSGGWIERGLPERFHRWCRLWHFLSERKRRASQY